MAFYFAMTAAELQHTSVLPQKAAYMACHFSPYATGISNLPDTLPEGSLIILNDRTPICGHDPQRIAHQLCQLMQKCHADGVLLDFQRPDCEETAALVQVLTAQLTCPLAVSQPYAAEGLTVFLPPIPPDVPIEEALSPWKNREIWLDVAPGHMGITVTAQGAEDIPFACSEAGIWHTEPDLCCHYQIQTRSDGACFFLHRTQEDIQNLLEKVKPFGVTNAVGLYQELAASDFEKL